MGNNRANGPTDPQARKPSRRTLRRQRNERLVTVGHVWKLIGGFSAALTLASLIVGGIWWFRGNERDTAAALLAGEERDKLLTSKSAATEAQVAELDDSIDDIRLEQGKLQTKVEALQETANENQGYLKQISRDMRGR